MSDLTDAWLFAIVLSGCSAQALDTGMCNTDADCGAEESCVRDAGRRSLRTLCPGPADGLGVCLRSLGVGCVSGEIEVNCVLICADGTIFKVE